MSIVWTPQAGPQFFATTAKWADELLYGGARGGGKTSWLLGDFLQDVAEYGADWNGVLFRRHYKELEEVIRQSEEMYTPTGATYNKTDHVWKWPNGAQLKFRYLERDQDLSNYQGHQYTWVGIDELGDWPSETTYKKVRALCRWTKREIPVKRVRCTANPGGIGHAWIKRYFIDPAPLGFKVLKSKTTGMNRVYVPAKVTDNKILMEKDPFYINKLKDLGSEDMVKAWLFGDWNIVAGAYFTQFRKHHIIQPFRIPETWTRFVTMDWGFAKDPFAVLWCAVADGSTQHPRGAVIVYRELYGANEKGETFEWIPQQVAQRINYLSMGERIDYYVADPSIFNRYNGISTGEMFAREGLYFQKGDNSRQIGWEQVRIRLVGVNDRPLIYFFSTCAKIIETLPIAPSDARDPTDIDTKCDDHALDALRYGLMTRPWISDVVESKKNINELTLDELFELNERRQSISIERI
jgi:Terminase large subunit, T4likevirus-type, N-terminal